MTESNIKQNQTAEIEKVYCVECGAETEFDCICDDLNFAQEQGCSCGKHNEV